MRDQLSTDLASLRIERNEQPPSGRSRIVTALAASAALIAAGAYAWSQAKERFFKPEVAVTEIRLVSPAQAAVQVTATGYVIPQVSSKISTGLLGRIAEMRVKEGQRVKKGEVLARIEDTEARSRLAAARARAEEARAQVAESRHQYERERGLAERGAQARSGADDLELHVASLEQSARAAVAEADALQAILKNSVVVAPTDGVVIGKPAGVGELMGPSMQGTILELADFASMVVETDVPEGRLAAVKVGQPAEIVLDAYPSQRIRGRVLEISPRVDRAKATVIVKVGFVDDVQQALPQMSARVSFLAQEQSADSMKEPPKLVVPSGAVVKKDGAAYVFEVDDGKVRRARIELGGPMESGFELVSGPGEGARVVDSPPASLQDGQAIKEKVR